MSPLFFLFMSVVVHEPIESSKLSKVVTPKEAEAPTGQKTIYRPPIVTYQQTFTSSDEGEKRAPKAAEGPQKSSTSSSPPHAVTKTTYV
jgi:hypothetical protein